MFPVPDAFAAFFLVCFFVGLLFVVVSTLMGMGEQIVHLPGFSHDVQVGDGGAAPGTDGGGLADSHPMVQAGHGDVSTAAADGSGQTGDTGDSGDRGQGHVTASPLNMMTIMAFLTWFGAAGYILHTFYGWFTPLAIVVALVAGGIAGWLVFLFLVKVLLPGTVGVRAGSRKIVGSLAAVTIAIPKDGLGEIVYTLGGARHSDGARGVDGLPIPRDTEVVIVRFEKGIAYVQPWQAFLGSGGAGQEAWRRFLKTDNDDR